MPSHIPKVPPTEKLTREMRLVGTPDAEARTVEAALSSEIEVNRYFGTEVLSHDDDAINMDRAEDGLPLLFMHDHAAPIGRVDNLRIDKDRKLRGTLTFSRNAKATEVWRDVEDGFLKNVSIGYSINGYEKTDTGIRATAWTINEASIVTVPADQTAGVNRKQEEKTMPTDNLPTVASASDIDAARKEGARAEQQRVAEINEVFKPYGDTYAEMQVRAVNDGLEVSEVRKLLLDEIGKDSAPAASGTITVEAGASERMADHMETAILLRSGLLKGDEEKQARAHNPYKAASLLDMARMVCEKSGIRTAGLDNMTLATRAIQDTADFPAILGNVANKSMLIGFDEADETWSRWARPGGLNNFQLTDLVALSAFDDLPEVPEGAAYTDGAFSDIKEQAQLKTYGLLWKITRQAIINDSLGAFNESAQKMGRSASRKVGDLAYGTLTSNPTMVEDGFPLFDNANHNNTPLAGTALDTAAIQLARVAMGLQTDPSGNAVLGIRPAYLLVPLELEDTALALMNSEFLVGTAPGNLEPNPIRGTMEVVADHRLSAASATGWYMLANQNQWDTVNVYGLGGAPTPFMERDPIFNNDSTAFKVRVDATSAAAGWRGAYYNPGA